MYIILALSIEIIEESDPTIIHAFSCYIVVTAAAFSFGGTIVIIKRLDKTIGLRVTEEQEQLGLDLSEHAEKAYL